MGSGGVAATPPPHPAEEPAQQQRTPVLPILPMPPVPVPVPTPGNAGAAAQDGVKIGEEYAGVANKVTDAGLLVECVAEGETAVGAAQGPGSARGEVPAG